MLDIRLLREKTELMASGLGRMGVTREQIDELLALDSQVRSLKTDAESRKAELNSLSKAMGRISPQERDIRRAELRELGDVIDQLNQNRVQLEAQLDQIMLLLPNMPDDRVPDGAGEGDNLLIRSGGVIREFDFAPLPHWEIGSRLGILDIERGIKLSGSRFYVLRGAGAALQRALITYMLDIHTIVHKHTEIYPPFMVKRECLVGTGQLPKFADNLYHDAEEDYWFIPTAEAPVTNLHRDEILDASLLPIRYVAYTPCFRREKMSAGRDVRGIKRGHQFDKVEMVRFCTPQDSEAELELMVQEAEDICSGLGLPYRTVLVCTGEKGEFNSMQYDIEVYAPAGKGEEGGEWLEVSSCSNFRDFQARRINLRYRLEPGSKPEYLHTLNGSGLALPRVMIAILENYQNRDGSVSIPEALKPYLHGRETIGFSSV